MPHTPGGASVKETATELVAKIGENISVRRTIALSVNPGVVATYVHNASSPELGKIGVLVALKSTADKTKLAALGKQIAMHIAAAAPLALTAEHLSPDVIARERAIHAELARQSGKPENVVEKMIEGRMRKFYEEAVLLNQTFVIDGETQISKVRRKSIEGSWRAGHDRGVRALRGGRGHRKGRRRLRRRGQQIGGSLGSRFRSSQFRRYRAPGELRNQSDTGIDNSASVLSVLKFA